MKHQAPHNLINKYLDRNNDGGFYPCKPIVSGCHVADDLLFLLNGVKGKGSNQALALVTRQ